jgi:hypothetical protein
MSPVVSAIEHGAPGRRELHEAVTVVDLMVLRDAEADLIDVDRFGAIAVATGTMTSSILRIAARPTAATGAIQSAQIDAPVGRLDPGHRRILLGGWLASALVVVAGA